MLVPRSEAERSHSMHIPVVQGNVACRLIVSSTR
jgi:hypothetical protein